MNAILYRTYLKIQVIYNLKISDLAPFRSHRGDEQNCGVFQKGMYAILCLALHTLHLNKLVKCKLNDIVLRNRIRLFFQFHPITENCKKKKTAHSATYLYIAFTYHNAP